MKRVLLLNQGHTDNYGDQAINLVLKTVLNSCGLDVQEAPFWNAKAIFPNNQLRFLQIKFFHRIPFIVDLFYKRFVLNNFNVGDFDVIIVGGGELIGGHYGFNSALYIWTKLAKKRGVPLCLYGVSGSTLRMRKDLIKRNIKSFNSIQLVFVRDLPSFNVVKNDYKKDVCYLCHDVVFSLPKVINVFPLEKKEYDVVVPIAFIDQVKRGLSINSIEEYCKYLFGLIQLHTNLDNKLIITPTCKDDETICGLLLTFLKNYYPEKEIVFFPYSSLNEFLRIISRSENVISGRMHGMILAFLSGSNIWCVPFKEKLTNFVKTYSSSSCQCIVEETYNEILAFVEKIRSI